ncbi:hypothetical protein THII_0700 [Thioploca ingrica]|uniref:MORN repeat protein n=1 Tax=Thioploca ingrica TaxID=40754 RepID=A0A090AI11_9GAMM|nr:hypothetical protein THII_0700 [Thioploca ingrica]
MTKINYLLIVSLMAVFFIAIQSPPLISATDDGDFDEEDAPIVKKSVCWSNGDCYEGEYEGKNRTGKGVYTWANGDRYQGEFYEGGRDGNGTYIWVNGDRYVGEYLEDKRDGEGIYTWANGDQFKGEFVAGKRSKGKIIRAAKTTPEQSKSNLKSETPVSTPKATLEKPTVELKQREDKVNVTQSAQKIEPEKAKPETNKAEKPTEEAVTDTESMKNSIEKPEETVTYTESMKDSIEKPEEKTASLQTDTKKLKEAEVNTTPQNLNDKLEKDSATAANQNKKISLAKEVMEEAFSDDFEPDHSVETDKKLTDTEDTKVKEEEKIATTVTGDEKPAKAKEETKEETIAKNEPIPEQKLTVAKLEDKPAKLIEATPKIVEKKAPLEPQDNVADANLPSEQTLFKWPNGDSYEGKYLNKERTGKGIYIWPNGERYTGDFMAGKRHGIGAYVWSNGDRYEGEYVNDERHGKGTYTWANGDRYEGDFFKGQRHGKGKLTWADGEVYEGAFAEGKRTGLGIYISSGGDRYEGYFEEGKRSGKGILVLADRQPKQLEFENELYTLNELEFKAGQLISATATNQPVEDKIDAELKNNAKATESESKPTTQTPATKSDAFQDHNEENAAPPLEEKKSPIIDKTNPDSNEPSNDNGANKDHRLDREKIDSNDEVTNGNDKSLSKEKSDNAEFQNNNRDEEY